MTDRIDTAALRLAHEATTSALQEMLSRARKVVLWGDCLCDGYSIGHEPGCQRTVVAQRLELTEADKIKIGTMLPDIVAALAHEQWPALLDEIERLRAQVEADRDTFRDADIIDDPIGAAAQMEAGYRKCMAALGEPMPPPPEQGQ